MTTTHVMEGEDIGGLTRRHFIKMIGVGVALTVGGIAAAALWPNKNDSPLPENPAIVMPAEEKSEKYKTLAAKYAEQIEAGKKYVAEKYGLSTGQVEAVVVDEILPGYGPKKFDMFTINKIGHLVPDGDDLLPPSSLSVFVAYAHPKGDSILFIETEGKIHEQHGTKFCDGNMKKAAQIIRAYMKKNLRTGSEIAFRDIHPADSRNNKLYNAEVIDGWDNTHRRTSLFERYVINVDTGQFQPFSGIYFSGGYGCE